jgi:hypothetical protein
MLYYYSRGDKMDIPEELNSKLLTIEDALTECFGGFNVAEDGLITVQCCGEINYGYGIMGCDIIQCKKCKRAVINILSPHVSPLLIRGSTTSIPTDEFMEAVGDRNWMVFIEEKS